MIINTRTFFIITLLFIGYLGTHVHAYAYDNACVYLKVGAGYVSKFQITYADKSKSKWSDSIAIGQHACLSINKSKAPVGSKFTVKEKAFLGNTTTCIPKSITQDTSTSPITFFATGTTLNHHCETLRAETLTKEPVKVSEGNTECNVDAGVQQCCSAKKCNGKVLSNRDAHNCKVKSRGKSWHDASGNCYNM